MKGLLPHFISKVVTVFDLFKLAINIARLRVDKLEKAKAAYNNYGASRGDILYGEARGLDTVLELLGIPIDSMLRPNKSMRDWRRPPWL